MILRTLYVYRVM